MLLKSYFFAISDFVIQTTIRTNIEKYVFGSKTGDEAPSNGQKIPPIGRTHYEIESAPQWGQPKKPTSIHQGLGEVHRNV